MYTYAVDVFTRIVKCVAETSRAVSDCTFNYIATTAKLRPSPSTNATSSPIVTTIASATEQKCDPIMQSSNVAQDPPDTIHDPSLFLEYGCT